MTRDEVTAVRVYFNRQVDRYMEERNRRRAAEGGGAGGGNGGEAGGGNGGGSGGDGGGDVDPDPMRERLRMEDEWMSLQVRGCRRFGMNMTFGMSSLIIYAKILQPGV